MKTLREFIFNLNFRHTFTMALLITFMILVGVPFWISTKDLKENTHAWSYLSSAIGIIGTLLTLAGRRYFEPKTNEQQGNISQGGISHNSNLYSGGNTPNCPNCPINNLPSEG